jgi:hypothetical protein
MIHITIYFQPSPSKSKSASILSYKILMFTSFTFIFLRRRAINL